MDESENADWSGVSGGVSTGFDGVQLAQPPSVAQAFLTGLLGRVAECGHQLQQTCEDAGFAADDPALEHYRVAAEFLSIVQHSAASVAGPLAMAENHMEAFKAAVEQNTRDVVEAASGPEGAQEDPVRLLRAVLTTNTKNAAEAHAEVISSNFWNEGIAGHYSKRAELLESTFSGNGDEHAVIVLLADDTRRAETAFAAASRGDWDSVSSQLSGAGHVHRDATIRLFKLMKSIQEIPGLEV